MKIEFDADHDILNIEFLDKVPIEESLELDGVVVDYATDKRIVAIEVLDASKRTTHDPTDLIGLSVVRAKTAPPDRVREREAGYGRKKKGRR